MVEKQSEKNIKILRSDNGGEYVSGALKRYYKDKKIQQQFWVSYTPQKKGHERGGIEQWWNVQTSCFKVKTSQMVFEMKPFILLFI